jgi:hypothetical protein
MCLDLFWCCQWQARVCVWTVLILFGWNGPTILDRAGFITGSNLQSIWRQLTQLPQLPARVHICSYNVGHQAQHNDSLLKLAPEGPNPGRVHNEALVLSTIYLSTCSSVLIFPAFICIRTYWWLFLYCRFKYWEWKKIYTRITILSDKYWSN